MSLGNQCVLRKRQPVRHARRPLKRRVDRMDEAKKVTAVPVEKAALDAKSLPAAPPVCHGQLKQKTDNKNEQAPTPQKPDANVLAFAMPGRIRPAAFRQPPERRRRECGAKHRSREMCFQPN